MTIIGDSKALNIDEKSERPRGKRADIVIIGAAGLDL